MPEPDPEHWQERGQGARPRGAPALLARRDAAALSLGRVPARPNSLPMLERNLAVLAASALPPQVIAYAADMFALYVGAFAYEESLQTDVPDELGAYFAVAAAGGLPDAHAARRRPHHRRRGRALRVRARTARPRPGGDGLR